MKKKLLILCSLALAVISAQLDGAPFGTAFTYQGRLTGGFWSFMPQVSTPRMKIEKRAGSLVLSWPANGNRFVVQSARQLTSGSADWSDVAATPVQVGDEFELLIDPNGTPPSPIRFFRLHAP